MLRKARRDPAPWRERFGIIVLDCDVPGADELNDRARERRRKERKREKRQRRKERNRRGKSKRRDSSFDDSGSSTSSGTNSSSSGSSLSSSGRSSRTRKKHTKSTARRAGNIIAGRKEGEIWRGTGSAANTEFTLLGGRRHFKSKRSGAWEDLTDPPKSKCLDCSQVAQLHGLGLPARFIMLWGGGVEVCDKAPPRWQFERGGAIPLPQYGTSATTARMQPGTTLGMWPSWIRSELEIPNVRLARAEPSPERGTAPAQKRSRTDSPKGDVVEIEDSP